MSAVLQTCLSKSWGGLEMVAWELATRMQREGIPNVTACSPGSVLHERLLAGGLEVLPCTRGNKYFSPSTILTLRRALKSGRFSAVLVEQLNELWQVVPALIGMRDVRLIGISHTLLGSGKKDFLHASLYGRMDRLVALTEIHRKNLLDKLPVRDQALAVIPNAVDLVRFNPSKRLESLRNEFLRAPDELLLGVVSRIDKGKGLREVVEACALLKREGLRFRLIMAGRETIGEEGMAAVLRADIRERGLENEVFLIGHRPDVDAVMASLDIMIMPSPGETFGRVLIEAMASGTAIVACSGGGVPDIIHDGEDGLMVPPLAVEPLTAAILRCARDRNLRERLAHNGLEAARKKYDQKKLDRELYQLLGV